MSWAVWGGGVALLNDGGPCVWGGSGFCVIF